MYTFETIVHHKIVSRHSPCNTNKKIMCTLKVSNQLVIYDSVTITTHSSTDGSTTLYRMNLSGHVVHVTIFS